MTARGFSAAGLAAVAAAAGCFQQPDPDVIQTSPETHCLTCHLHDYQRTTAPVHDGSFPRTCDDCHATGGWQPALEAMHPQVSRFPIDDGEHAGVACLDCHDPARGPSAAGGNAICTSCHAHRRSEMDGKHGDEDGYQWRDDDPRFCLDCHYLGGE